MHWRAAERRLGLLALIVAAACAAETAPPTGEAGCTVSSVGDGDSFRCAPDGARVRLLLIDAPELDQPPFGARARDALAEIMPPGTWVRFESDVRPTDDFGRTLAYVYLEDGRMVNEELARSGMVVPLVYPPNVRYVDRIRAAVEAARSARRGLWATNVFDCLPVDFRAGRCGR